MVRVFVEVSSGLSRLKVAVQAENIQQALNFAADRFPGGAPEVMFPIEPEGFFVADRAAETRLLEPEMLERVTE
jgi:hypothetical protein